MHLEVTWCMYNDMNDTGLYPGRLCCMGSLGWASANHKLQCFLCHQYIRSSHRTWQKTLNFPWGKVSIGIFSICPVLSDHSTECGSSVKVPQRLSIFIVSAQSYLTTALSVGVLSRCHGGYQVSYKSLQLLLQVHFVIPMCYFYDKFQ